MTEMGWKRLAGALEYYRGLGYKYTEVPWIVPSSTVDFTIPSPQHRIDLHRGDASLIGSGEQGFIQRLIEGDIQPGKWMTITPCHRLEIAYTDKVRPWFMKLELFILGDGYEIIRMATEAMNLFRMWIRSGLKIVETPIGVDVMYLENELGSYGKRVVGDKEYLYGTGLAEPRFSMCCGST